MSRMTNWNFFSIVIYSSAFALKPLKANSVSMSETPCTSGGFALSVPGSVL